jgi:hypothetical protein
MADLHVLDKEWADRIKKMWRWMRGFSVRGAASIRNTEENCTITVSGSGADQQQAAKGNRWITFRISSDHACGGIYYAKSIDHSLIASDIGTGSTFEVGHLGSEASADDVLAVNTAEETSAGHTIDQAVYPATFAGRWIYTNSDGMKVVLFTYEQGEDCVIA